MSNFSDPQTAVDAGQTALKPWNGYPWYDPHADSLRPVTIEPIKPIEFDARVPDSFSLVVQCAVWSALAVAIAAICYFLVRAYMSAIRDLTHDKLSQEPGHAQRIEALPMNVDAQEADLLAAARRYYAEGNFAKAIVCYFGFQLVELDRMQIIHLAQGKTNRQYLRELGSRAQLRQLVSQTMVISEDAYFGHHAPPRERFESCWSRLSEFQKLVGQEA